MKRIKQKCYYCNNKATWLYMPCDYEKNKKTWWQIESIRKKDYYCDIHVPRGCSCNNIYEEDLDESDSKDDLKFIGVDSNGNNIYTSLDIKGREYPCCEFWYDKDGFDF